MLNNLLGGHGEQFLVPGWLASVWHPAFPWSLESEGESSHAWVPSLGAQLQLPCAPPVSETPLLCSPTPAHEPPIYPQYTYYTRICTNVPMSVGYLTLLVVYMKINFA